MWNGRKYAAMAIAGIGFTVAASAPASAQYYGAAGGSGDYGNPGAYSYGRPYTTPGLPGYGGSGGYGYRGAYGSAHGAALGADRNGSATRQAPYFNYAGDPSYGPNHGYSFRWGARRVPGYGYGAGDRLH
jgi:hypothetical protein